MTEPEYQQLVTLCSTSGVRTVSEAARTAVETYLVINGAQGDAAANEIRVLRSRLEDLNRKIDHLSELLGAARASGA